MGAVPSLKSLFKNGIFLKFNLKLGTFIIVGKISSKFLKIVNLLLTIEII